MTASRPVVVVTDRFVVVPASYVFLLREGDVDTEVLRRLGSGTATAYSTFGF